MPLLLTQDDLRPLFDDPTFYPQLFAVIRSSLLNQGDETAGDVTWLAFPTQNEQTRLNVQPLSGPTGGTSVKIFPHRVGAQAADSMLNLLFDDQTGALLALMSLDDLGPLRTAAPTAFAAQVLAPPDTRTLALLGSGLQARYHLLGARAALPELDEVRVFSPNPEHREHFAQEMRDALGLAVRGVASTQDALAEADVVMVTAAAYQPIFTAEWVRPGALVTTISARAIPRDLPARLVVPAFGAPQHHPSGFDPFPFRPNGGREPAAVAVTLVDVLRGTGQARTQPSDIVLYEQSGVFGFDAAMTRWVYDWAVAHHAGSEFHLTSR